MDKNPRPRRAFLYVPANDERKVRKAAALGADCVCLDLEDAVSESGKDAARQGMAQALSALDFGRSERWARVNAPASARFSADLRAAAAAAPDGILIPKVENAAALQQADALLKEAGAHAMMLGAIVESPLGILNLREICAAAPRLALLVFGAEDYAAALGVSRQADDSECAWALGALVAHAAAFGLDAIDLVCNEYRNMDVVRASALRGAALGMRGKQVIHPAQVAVAHEVFSPSTQEVEHARQIVLLYEKQQKSGSGALGLAGSLVDMPVYRQALNTLARSGQMPQS